MATILDVAKYILDKTGRISTWKLQKLCYYAQAWALAWTERPLFQEDFEAWSNGPVSPVLYQKHKGKFMLDSSEFPYGNPDVLTEDEKETVDLVLAHYGSWEPYALREQTHREAPWRNARNGIPDDIPSNATISQGSMGDYYGSL